MAELWRLAQLVPLEEGGFAPAGTRLVDPDELSDGGVDEPCDCSSSASGGVNGGQGEACAGVAAADPPASACPAAAYARSTGPEPEPSSSPPPLEGAEAAAEEAEAAAAAAEAAAEEAEAPPPPEPETDEERYMRSIRSVDWPAMKQQLVAGMCAACRELADDLTNPGRRCPKHALAAAAAAAEADDPEVAPKIGRRPSRRDGASAQAFAEAALDGALDGDGAPPQAVQAPPQAPPQLHGWRAEWAELRAEQLRLTGAPRSLRPEVASPARDAGSPEPPPPLLPGAPHLATEARLGTGGPEGLQRAERSHRFQIDALVRQGGWPVEEATADTLPYPHGTRTHPYPNGTRTLRPRRRRTPSCSAAAPPPSPPTPRPPRAGRAGRPQGSGRTRSRAAAGRAAAGRAARCVGRRRRR